MAETEWIFRVLGAHGWSTVEVDEMELWQVARFIGLGDDGPDPVIRGARSLMLKTDERGGSKGGAGLGGNLDARVAEAKARLEARRVKE